MKAVVMLAWLSLLGCSSRVAFEEPADTDGVIPPWRRPDAAAVDGEFQGVETQATTSTERDPADAGASSTEPDAGTVPSTTSGECTAECEDAGGEQFDGDKPCEPGTEPCFCYVETACAKGDDDCSGVEVWSITVDQNEFNALNEEYRADIRIPATLCVDSKLYELTLEVQGASSRRLPKKNYNFRFDKHNELPGKYLGAEGTIDKLVAKAMATDRTLIRETLAFDLWRAMGHDAPYSGGVDGFIQLVVNGRFHGVYSRVEPVDRDYMRRRNMQDDGRLFKGVRKNGGRADFRPGRVLEDAFEDKTDPDDPDYTALQELLSVIQDANLSPEEFVTEIGKYLSLDLIIDRMAWVSFTQNGDAVAQNFFLYYRAQEQPPWHLIPWDSNLCFGADWEDPENWLSPNGGFLLGGGNLLAERLLEHPPVAEAFRQRYAELLAGLFTSDALQARMWPLMDSLLIALDRDRAIWGYQTDASTAFEELAEFLAERPTSVEAQLELWP